MEKENPKIVIYFFPKFITLVKRVSNLSSKFVSFTRRNEKE